MYTHQCENSLKSQVEIVILKYIHSTDINSHGFVLKYWQASNFHFSVPLLTIFHPVDLVVSTLSNLGQLFHNLVGDSLFSLDILLVSPILK